MSQFSRKIGWNVVLIAVGNTKLWRDCVSNKEIADEKEKKGCARGENLWKKKREKLSWSHRMYCLKLVFVSF